MWYRTWGQVNVLLQARSAGLLAPESARPVGRNEVLVSEDRVSGKVVSRLHVVAPMRLQGYLAYHILILLEIIV